MASKTDVTTAISTATANMVDSTKATNFTNGLQSGGVDVATAADLKSVEASAWRQLDNKYIIPDSGNTLAPYTTILYKIDDSIHTLYLSGTIVINDIMVDNVSVTVKLGSIIKSILTVTAPYIGYNAYDALWHQGDADKNSTDLKFLLQSGVASMTVSKGTGGSLAHITYDKLV